MEYVLKIIVGPWMTPKTFKCLSGETVRGALGFRTHEEALTFGKWISDNAEKLKGQMRDESQAVAEAEKRTPRS